MSNIKDFQIKDGVLKKYKGTESTVIIPEGVTAIGDRAFCECENLIRISIPESVTVIGYCSFANCTKLESITLPCNLTDIGDLAFGNCVSLQSIAIPRGIQTIRQDLFYCCTALETVILPDNVKDIETHAFYGCEKLKNIRIPPSAVNIGAQAFYKCKALADENGFVIFNDVLYDYLGTELDVVIPNGVKKIGVGAFWHCEKLKSVVLPESLEIIECHAFSHSSSLKSIIIPNNVKSIGYMAFYLYSEMETVSIGNGIQSIHKVAFPDKMNVRNWTLAPDSEDEDQIHMLLNTFGTKNLALSFLLDTMQTNALLRKKLQSRITNKLFREQFIPMLIEQNEAAAIAKMLSLIKKMPPDEIDSYIEKAESSAEIRIMLLEYKKHLYPADILNKMEEIQMEKSFGLREKTLADYKKIFSIKKENSIYLITQYKGTEQTVVIPAKIREIPVRFTLKNNDSASDVILEDGHTEILSEAFFACKALKTVTIPESIQAIGENAFAECENITICAPVGSYAEAYAKENNIKIQTV